MQLNKGTLLVSLVWMLGLKLLYLLLAFIEAQLGVQFNKSMFFLNYSGSIDDYLHIFYRNDSGWYAAIARDGYDVTSTTEYGTVQSAFAFFPIYPMLLRLLMTLFSISAIKAAFIWSLILPTAAIYQFYEWAKNFTGSEEKTSRALVLLCLFPFHFFLSMFLTEALFLFLLLSCFRSIDRQNFALLALFGALLCLTRPNGVIMALPLMLYYFEKNPLYPLEKNLPLLLSFFVFAAALIGWCYIQYSMTSNAFAFSAAQEGWGRHWRLPWISISINGAEGKVYTAYLLLTIGLSLANLRKTKPALHLMVWINLILPLASGLMLSLHRFISVLFIVPVWLEDVLSKQKKISFKWLFVICFLLHILSFHQWLVNNALSY